MQGLQGYLIVSTLLFSIGFFGVLLRRNTLVLYMSLELMLNAINLAFVAFSRYNNIFIDKSLGNKAYFWGITDNCICFWLFFVNMIVF